MSEKISFKDFGLWEPKELVVDQYGIDREWRLKLEEIGFPTDEYEVRRPGFSLLGLSEDHWHHDLLHNTQHNLVIVWTNVLPTRIKKVHARKEISTFPMHIYAFDNDEYLHAAPFGSYSSRSIERWFARAHV